MCVDVSHVLKGQQFMIFMVFLFYFLMAGLSCCCILHPKHPLHSYHGFVFCFVYYRYSFYLWKHMVAKFNVKCKMAMYFCI